LLKFSSKHPAFGSKRANLPDLYRGDVPVQRNPFTLMTYIALFSQLIADPSRSIVGR